MQSFAHITVGGHLGADPEVRYNQKGTEVINMSVAVGYRVPPREKDSDAEWEDRTMWYRCTWVGSRAASMSAILEKGMAVVVTGRLQAEAYEARDSRECRIALNLFVSDCWIADRREQPGGDSERPAAAGRGERPVREPAAAARPAAARPARQEPTSTDLDDLPF